MHAVEFAREAGARENRIEIRRWLRRRARAGRDRRAAGGQLVEDARDFGGFFFAKLHQAIIQLDGFERLDENGLARGAGGVHHARRRGGRRRARE